MVKVENRDTLRLLTGRFMKRNRVRNVIAVLSVILTCLLFTSLFTGIASMMMSRAEADKKQYMLYSHAVAANLTAYEEQKLEEVLADCGFVEKYGVTMTLGTVSDDRLRYQVELRCADQEVVRGIGCLPEFGRMPESDNEAAVSVQILDALGLPHILGEEIELPVNVTIPDGRGQGEIRTERFRLCGYWEGERNTVLWPIWVSEAYAAGLEEARNERKINCYIWYKNFWDIKGKTETLSGLTAAAGLDGQRLDIQINPAYERLVGEGGISPAAVLAVILLILLSGCLIIYNIFDISVRNDIRTYGLLKSVGTTGKQLKKIVRMQAYRLSAAGILPGLLLGYALGSRMVPALLEDMLRGTAADAVLPGTVYLLIFGLSGIFTFLTVFIASSRACRLVEKVSPMEALRMAEGRISWKANPMAAALLRICRTGSGSGKMKRMQGKVTAPSWWEMAWRNMWRNRRTGLLVMISMSISLITVNCIVMMTKGYDLDEYRQIYQVYDFQLDKFGATSEYSDCNAISPQVRGMLEGCPDIAAKGYVYYSEELHDMEPHLCRTWEAVLERYGDTWGTFWQQIWEERKSDGQIQIECMGISRSVFEKLEWEGEACTWEDFETGNYVIAEHPYYLGEKEYFYQKGDGLTMEYQSGAKKKYQVAGEANLPYSMDYPYVTLVSVKLLVPETEFVACTGNDYAMRAGIDALEGQEEELQRYLEENILKKDSTMNLISVLNLEGGFRQYMEKYYAIGGSLVLVLAFIGIMNFFNTCTASIWSRKRELALLEAMGMTKKQLRKMLKAEGAIYLIGAQTAAILLTRLWAGRLLKSTFGIAFFFHLKVTVLPGLLMLPLMAVTAWAIPEILFRDISKESLVNRIRME